MNKEPIIKNKKYDFKKQYIYNGILLLVLLFGMTYAYVFFMQNEQGTSASLKSSLVTVDVSEEGTINLTNAKPVTDEEGLNGVSKVITVTNTSDIDTLLKISLNPDDNNTIDTSNIRYGLYINGTLEKVGAVGPSNTVYDGLLLSKKSVEYEIYLWIDNYYEDDGTSFSGTFEVTTEGSIITISDYISKLVGKDKGIYAINSSGEVSTDGTDIREYRYSGLDVDNYVWFNCKDGYTSENDNCELWRIVGSFDIKSSEHSNTYQRVKIVKDEVLESRAFGSNHTFSGSDMDIYLNGDYYNNLTDSAKKMIISGQWNVGSVSTGCTPNESFTREPSSKVYKNIGLLSASDIGYATSPEYYTKFLYDSNLYKNSWLTGSEYYTLTPMFIKDDLYVLSDDGNQLGGVVATTELGVRPTVYLMPSVYIKTGNGSIDKPYELSYIDEVEHYSNIKVSGYITYDVNGGEVNTPNKQAIYADGSTIINKGFDDTSFLGWATSTDGDVVYQKGDTLTETSDITLYAVWKGPEKLVDKITSTISLTTADSDGTRFVYGNTVNNNYVWYSGKLWRIVSIDEDGNVKLVTQGNMTTIAWNTTSSNTDYSTSQIRRWLKNEFLPTLHDRDNLLVDYEWDYTTYEEFPTGKLATTASVTEKVGLLNIYEYMKTGGEEIGSNGSINYGSVTFLNNGYDWWTMSPKTSGSNVWRVNNYGNASDFSPTNSHCARPSVNLKSGIIISGGTGEKTNPYTIEGDKVTGTTSELLSNRISGEYINFNNTKYRIVGIETINGQQLTKVTMADYDDNKKNVLTTSQAFGSTATYSIDEGVGKYLLDWYNSTEESDVEAIYAGLYISDTYKKMIATSGDEGDGVYWWIGSGTSTKDYTLSKSGTTVETPIGLGYYGELFSSQFGDGYDSSTDTWLMTKYSDSRVWYVCNDGYASYDSPSSSYGARPSFYLKANVEITGGTGMPHDPYEIQAAKPIGHITYNANGVDVAVPAKTEIYDGIPTIINASLDNISKYYFLGWSTSPTGDVVYKKGDIINVTSDVTLYAVWEEKTLEPLIEKITSTLTLTSADSDGTRFVTGTDVNNYVSYSGMLWRAVGVNSDGTIKLITQDSVASLPWDSAGGRVYSTSSIRTYLNSDFLSTLNTDLIVDSTWDYSMTASSKPDGTLTVTEKVGLLSYYEYYSVSNGNTSNYLVNGSWWTLTVTGTSKLSSPYVINSSGGIYYDEPASFPTMTNDVRPSVVLKANIKVESNGLGTVDYPYVITVEN